MEGFSRINDVSYMTSEEKKLELRLGPPGEEDWRKNGTTTSKINIRAKRDNSSSYLSLGYMNNGSREDSWINENHHNFSTSFSESNSQVLGNTNVSPWSISSCQYKQSLAPAMGKESLQCNSGKVMVELQNAAEKKGFLPASANNTAVPNNLQKRITPARAPVVGWPPIRSFRKNLASGCASKLPAEIEASNEVSPKIASKKQTESCRKGFYVKINMDGVPIGRKVDLKAYDSYEKLSSAVDELFRGLLAAQTIPSANNIQNNQDREKTITGLLDRSGEYTLVYEDNEGDRMLVGDVPWHMFVSTVKRLRVLKSSELSSLLLGSKQEKEPT